MAPPGFSTFSSTVALPIAARIVARATVLSGTKMADAETLDEARHASAQ
jgi:hypothetical protein